jgi:hypothetical protein
MVAAEPKGFMHDVALRDARAPNNPGSMIPSSQQGSSRGGAASNTPGWAAPTPLGPVPGINHVDRIVEADTARQRADAIMEEGRRRAALGKK